MSCGTYCCPELCSKKAGQASNVYLCLLPSVCLWAEHWPETRPRFEFHFCCFLCGPSHKGLASKASLSQFSHRSGLEERMRSIL